ncbi:MAG TPA: glycoside hydrolase domain-containing protein, partial [Mucilaginibacter sp.]
MKIPLFAIFFLLNGFEASAQKIPYTNCEKCWPSDSLGNHRVVLTFNGSGKIAKAIIPWRRRDNDPESKRIIMQDGQTGKKISNVQVGAINRETGEIMFEPTSGKGTYFVYYMPYKNEGRSNYPKGIYLKPENTASEEWLKLLNSTADIQAAAVKEFQSIDAFNSFYPMEVIATQAETDALIKKNRSEAFLVFPESRVNSIRMTRDLPQRWIERGPQSKYTGEAARGENFAFQLGIYALQDINDVKITFSSLKSPAGKIIPASALFCINTGGTTYDGKPFIKTVNVAKGEIQALWCGVNIPAAALPGIYSGAATVSLNGKMAKPVQLAIKVSNRVLKDGGVSEPYKMTRLGWLNSTMAQQNTVIAPYTPLTITGNTISLLGRKIEVNEDGFPKQIQTYFTPEMTDYAATPDNLLTEGIHFHFVNANGKRIKLKSEGVQYTKKEAGTFEWTAVTGNDSLQMTVTASLEFDGFMAYTVKVKALQNITLKDVTMHIPLKKDFAKYMMGLGQKGGYRPEGFEWKWDVAHKNQDGAWIGNVNGGLQFSLRDENYVRPLNTNFYLQKPLLLPKSWGNDNKGGIKVAFDGKAVLVNNYTGERDLKKGDELYYNFTLLITPFHTINTDFQWATRFYHSYKPIDTIKKAGATLINIHHATAINPTINYPFIAWQKMKAYDDSAHAAGLKVKIYNTIRELSNHAYETFALRSLGHEIYSPGKGGGFSWLQEHVGDDYIAAWFVPEIKDAAVINSGMNRWHNYYVEGMNWLAQNVGIDGIYLDDVAFDRVTMKRLKRVLTKNGHPGIIDLHSANQYNKSDGFN